MQKIGRYEIERELGRGAMGIVYLARDTRLGRAVALKTIRLGDFADAGKLQRLRERLIREAQSAGSLSHENIVTIYDVDELDEISYISMEFVEGESLERMLERRRELSREALLALLRQVASGLDFAHSRGIVHRDVKPPNVMVTPLGKVKLTDFGVAKVTYANSMTQGGAMLGTPDYMSPEQIDGRNVDGRADQFSLGVIAFELLTGEKPFIADSLAALFYRIAHEPLPDATLLNPSLSPEVGEVLQRAMAKRPEQRYPNCIAFLDALSDACSRAVGWHALARGMSHTLPTAHDPAPVAASSPSGFAAPPLLPVAGQGEVAPPPMPPPAAEPPVAATARHLPPLGGTPPAPEAGFITAAPIDSMATLEGPPAASREWLQSIEQEEAARRTRRRRNVVLSLLTFLLLAGGLAGIYYWLGGEGLLDRPLVPGAGTESALGPSPEDGGAVARDSAVSQGAATMQENATVQEDGETPEGEGTAADSDAATTAASSAAGAPELPATSSGAQEASPQPSERQSAASAVKPGIPVVKPAPAEPKAELRPAAPRPVSPPRERLATVRFMTDPPGARITVDASPSLSCESPCSLEIPVGRHTYSARRAGYRNEIRSMDVSNYGITVNVKLERAVGMVRVSSTPPGAAVLVNGERQSGVTPLTLRLLPGDYRVVIERDGRRVERNVSVREDALVQLTAALEP